MYAKPNPSFNSYRAGGMTNVPPDNGNPERPHAFDRTCLCETCLEYKGRQARLIRADIEATEPNRLPWGDPPR